MFKSYRMLIRGHRYFTESRGANKTRTLRSAVTNARFAALHLAARRPVPLSTTPAPLRKTARSSRAALALTAGAAGFRLRLDGGTLRPGSNPLNAPFRPLSTFPARQPQMFSLV
jgi:hypothetical protein